MMNGRPLLPDVEEHKTFVVEASVVVLLGLLSVAEHKNRAVWPSLRPLAEGVVCPAY